MIRHNINLFSQIINTLPNYAFSRIVNQYQGDKHNKGINSWTHLVAMLFMQFSRSASLREITYGLSSTQGNLNHLGITKKCPKRSSLSYINKHRSSAIFKDFYYKLLNDFSSTCKKYGKKLPIKKKTYLLDSTIISLCMSLYPWAKYEQTKGAIKLHTLLDYEGYLPKYVYISDGKKSDVKAAEEIPIPKGSVVVADRGYESFSLLNDWNKAGIKFVVRIKSNTNFIRYKEIPLPEGRQEDIIIDEEVLLEDPETRKKYPEKLRRVVIYVEEEKTTIELITNNFSWTAETISKLYRSRWQIEIFFKEIKTHLKIKTFVGTSANAVEIQIWTALITILILRYMKMKAKFKWSLSNLINSIRLHLFSKASLEELLNIPFKPPGEEIQTTQYLLFSEN